MKYFIAFTLFFLTNCLVPTTTLAIINPKNGVTQSVVFFTEKLSFKQKLENAKPKRNLIILGLILIFIGLLIISVSKNQPIPQRQPLDFSISIQEIAIGIGNLICAAGIGLAIGGIVRFSRKRLSKL